LLKIISFKIIHETNQMCNYFALQETNFFKEKFTLISGFN